MEYLPTPIHFCVNFGIVKAAEVLLEVRDYHYCFLSEPLRWVTGNVAVEMIILRRKGVRGVAILNLLILLTSVEF